jgi:hypothetical protein
MTMTTIEEVKKIINLGIKQNKHQIGAYFVGYLYNSPLYGIIDRHE